MLEHNHTSVQQQTIRIVDSIMIKEKDRIWTLWIESKWWVQKVIWKQESGTRESKRTRIRDKKKDHHPIQESHPMSMACVCVCVRVCVHPLSLHRKRPSVTPSTHHHSLFAYADVKKTYHLIWYMSRVFYCCCCCCCCPPPDPVLSLCSLSAL